MKKRLVILAICAMAAACASDDYDRPYPAPPSQNEREDFDIIPLSDWWHQPAIANAVNLSSDQYAALDRIAAQADEVTRLQRDSAMAMRDLRETFDRDPVTAADINAAAQRARTLRDAAFDRETGMLAAERQVLSAQQWRTLQQQLQAQRENRRGGEGGYGRRGRGGMGGRGRRPGGF